MSQGVATGNGHIIEGSSSVPQFVAAFRFITHFRHGSNCDDDDDDDMDNILVWVSRRRSTRNLAASIVGGYLPAGTWCWLPCRLTRFPSSL